MKKISLLKSSLLMISIILLLSGCSVVKINSKSIDDTIVSILKEDTSLKTVSLEGYSYFLPQGVNLKVSKNLNSILYYNHNKMYLYVDIVSYFHKIENSYKIVEDAYYSKRIDINGKSGYVEITKINDNKYFIEFMFNYSKVETYSTKKNINKTLTVMAYILNSVKFNDSLLESLIGESSIKYLEEQFDIFKSNGSEDEFIGYIEQNDDGRMNSKDEDMLILDENVN